MPEYLYRCEACAKEFEAMHSIREELQECPTCKEAGRPPVPPTRLISACSFVLAGGGWSREGYSSK
jgi:putative FmdB family regulatory protein